jgi:hypothetical protein
VLEWLFLPIDLSRPHDVEFEVSWHARLMVLGWSVLIPIGIFAARFFKVLPRQDWPHKLDNQAWWVTHLVAQYLAGILMVSALYLIWNIRGSHSSSMLHQVMGWTTVSLCGIQYLAGWLRGSKGGPTELQRTGTIRGDHYDMTKRRILFEKIHKAIGYVCLLSSLAAVISGLWMVNAPKWMWFSILTWWGFVIVSFIKFQKIIGTLDTYQAIWGTDPELPGNKIPPIGIAIKRSTHK